MSNQKSSLPSSKPPLTASLAESPWLWLLIFAIMGLVAIEVIAPKYRSRQAQIERQFQGRQWAVRQDKDKASRESPVEFSTEENTLISLWPIRAAIAAVVVVSVVGLARTLTGRSEPSH